MLLYAGTNVMLDSGSPSLQELAVMLGKICRWGGSCKQFYPVLLHSLVVGSLVSKDIEIYGLLHDCAETVVGDIPTPIKTQFNREIEHSILIRIFDSFSIPFPNVEVWGEVKTADARALVAEAYLIGPPGVMEFFDARDEKAEELVKEQLSFCYEDVLESDGSYVKYFMHRVNKCLSEKLWSTRENKHLPPFQISKV